MALGVPVLARNIPGNSAIIQHRECGLLFDTPEVSHGKYHRIVQTSEYVAASGPYSFKGP